MLNDIRRSQFDRNHFLRSGEPYWPLIKKRHRARLLKSVEFIEIRQCIAEFSGAASVIANLLETKKQTAATTYCNDVIFTGTCKKYLGETSLHPYRS
jgi:hypothetical protein